ncbi:MAG: hypothetical protein IBJ15_05640 [Alphaproteobacteria bacterium]|nr:hypothetical protein [Alphaproteobacteria bacterium]
MASEENNFWSIASPWKDSIRFMEVSAFTQAHNGQRFIRYARVIFSSRLPDAPIEEFDLQTPSFSALQKIFKLSSGEFSKALNQISRAPHRIPGLDSVSGLHGPTNATLYKWQHPDAPGALTFPALMLMASNHLPTIHIDDISVELLNVDPLFDGAADLFRTLRISSDKVSGSRLPTIDIVARSPLYFNSQTQLSDEKLTVDLTLPKEIDRKDISIGVALHFRDGSKRRTIIPPENLSLKSEDQFTLVSATHDAGKAITAFLAVRYRGAALGRWALVAKNRRANPRIEAFETFFPSFDIQKYMPTSHKAEGSNAAKDLELAVSLLLSLTGLSTLHFGKLDGLNEGPDTIAFSNTSDVYVVETTTGWPDNAGKLQKLKERADTLRKKFIDGEILFREVLPICITSTKSSEIETARIKGAELGIALYCREEIEALCKNLQSSPPIDGNELLQALKSKVASKNSYTPPNNP